MTMHVFFILLFICSILTSITVEGIKKMFMNNVAKNVNIVAAIVAIALAAAIGICYAIMFAVLVNAQYVVTIVALCFLSWLCAMVGYDKVMQTIGQMTKK